MDTHTPDVKQILRLGFADSVRWLADDGETGRPARWVSTSLDEAAPGDILLLEPAAITAEVLAQARQRGVALLLVVGGGFPEMDLEIPPGLSLAVLEGEWEARPAQEMLLTMLINQRAALMERGVRIHAQLSQLAAEGGGLPALVKAMAELSGRGVLIQDKRQVILADYPSSTLRAIWPDILMQIQSTEMLPASLQDRKKAGQHSHIVTQTLPGGLARLIFPVVVGEVARGYVSLLGMAGELDALDTLVVEQGAQICAVEMARAKAVREAEKKLKGDLLTALLNDDLTPHDARLWVLTMGLDLEQSHVALRFSWDGPSPPSRRRLETLVNGEVARQELTAIVSALGAEVICFCQVPLQPARPEEAALGLGAAVLSQAGKEFTEVSARCGLGTPARDLGDWRMSFRQAGQALELARRFREQKPLYFPDLSVYRLLLQMEHSPELSAFQEETIGPLLAHDHAEEFIHTLEAYFAHHGNLTQTAEALYIHRNTLIYRLDRIAKLTDLDLDKPETRLAVQLALRIHRMRK